MKLTDKEIKLLNALLEHIPYYGEFNIEEKVHEIIDKDFKEVYSNLTNPTEQLLTIKEFLLEHGYAIKRNDVEPKNTFIELKEHGRSLKEQDSLELYEDYQDKKQKKQKQEEIIQMQFQNSQTLLNVAQANALKNEEGYQQRLNRLTGWIAIGTIVGAAAALIAALYYIFQMLHYFFF